jgi:predicted metal-dependent phosphoesterase TrpH
MIDLHTNSTASDGTLSPSALIAEAARLGLSAIALTDHDTTGGLQEAAKAAGENGIRFIHGIELEIAWKTNGEFHLLGLGLGRLKDGFAAAIEELRRRRLERNLEIIDRMNKAGIEVSYNEISALASDSDAAGSDPAAHSIGRPHFAAYLAERKIVKNREQAFARYLGKGKPFYIPKVGLEFEPALTLIHESGGIAVLAHPMSLYTAWGKLPELIKSLKEKGLDGIEAWHPSAKVSSCKRLEDLGKKLGLFITAGSDFHGEARGDRKLGFTAGGRKISESFLEEIPDLGAI